jgi:hypothetical protein
MRARGTIIMVAIVAAATGGCRQAPQRRPVIEQESTYFRNATPPPPPQGRHETKQERTYVLNAPSPESEVFSPGGMPTARNEPDVCFGLDAYPLPRTYEQILADAPKQARKSTGLLEARVVIGPDGNITHLRFMQLSSVDSINKYAVEHITKQHYKPAVVDGHRVSFCTIVTINIHL